MDVMALVVTVQMMTGAQPEVQLTPSAVMPVDRCEALVEKLNAMPDSEVKFDKMGRPVIYNHHKCVLVDVAQFQEALSQ